MAKLYDNKTHILQNNFPVINTFLRRTISRLSKLRNRISKTAKESEIQMYILRYSYIFKWKFNRISQPHKLVKFSTFRLLILDYNFYFPGRLNQQTGSGGSQGRDGNGGGGDPLKISNKNDYHGLKRFDICWSLLMACVWTFGMGLVNRNFGPTESSSVKHFLG